jgi:hypothetical protein
MAWWTTAIALVALAMLSGCATDMNSISPEARAAVETGFPDATVQTVQSKFGGLYEIELMDGETSREIKLHQDGTIIEIETPIAAADLPEPVAAAAAERSGGQELKEVEKVELLARQTLGGVEKLEEPEIFYEIEWLAAGFKREITVNPDGTLRQ